MKEQKLRMDVFKEAIKIFTFIYQSKAWANPNIGEELMINTTAASKYKTRQPQNLSAQFFCPTQKFWISIKTGFIGHP